MQKERLKGKEFTKISIKEITKRDLSVIFGKL